MRTLECRFELTSSVRVGRSFINPDGGGLMQLPIPNTDAQSTPQQPTSGSTRNELSIYSAVIGRAPTIDPNYVEPAKSVDIRDRVGAWMAETLRGIRQARQRIDAARNASFRSKPAQQPQSPVGVTLVGPSARRKPQQHA
jgi:hypothetical protein